MSHGLKPLVNVTDIEGLVTFNIAVFQVVSGLFHFFTGRYCDSPVSEVLLQKQQDLLYLLVEEAPWKKIDALKAKLLEPNIANEKKSKDTSKAPDNRKRYVLRCLEIIGSQEALDAVREFVHAEPKLTDDRDILRLAAGITGDYAVLKDRADEGTTTVPAVWYNPFEQGAQYILIKAGTFNYSITKQPEKMPDLYVAKFTVTNELYRQFISYLASKEVTSAKVVPVELYAQALRAKAAPVEGFSDYLQTETSLAKLFASHYDDDKRFNKNDQPVVGVTWYASRAYCLWLSLLESNGRDADIYRLPTEREWEYAAAGSEGRPYPWGNSEPTNRLANFNGNEGATTPVGRYPDGATPDGLYDMAGNVWEWMDDEYEENTSARALRGGSWNADPDDLRCSARSVSVPADSSYGIGFRVVRSSPSS